MNFFFCSQSVALESIIHPTGVTLSLIAIVSSVMFKEKLKLLSILSIVVMIGGVILLNL